MDSQATAFAISTTPEKPSADPVTLLRQKMEQLEGPNGQAYPQCIVPVPHYLTGRGFFPGGDGLWRELEQIDKPASIPFPIDGVLLLGQDFGSLAEYPPKTRLYELANLLTWKYVVPRLTNTDIPLNRVFFSNGLLGLRRSGPNTGKNPAMSDQKFVKMCSEFLKFQIQVQNPRLVIICDSLNQDVYQPLLHDVRQHPTNRRIFTAEVLGRQRVIAKTQHPSSDYGVINRNQQNYEERCNTLNQAWQLSSKLD